MASVRFKNVNKWFGKSKVLHNINLEIKESEFSSYIKFAKEELNITISKEDIIAYNNNRENAEAVMQDLSIEMEKALFRNKKR